MKPSRTSAARAAKYALRKPPVSMPVDLSAFNDVIAGIERDIEKAIRPAAQAGAQVIYEAVLANVARNTKSGTLRDAIYQAYSERGSVNGKVRYEVSWNPRKAPHGHLLEFGHIQRYAARLADDGKWYTLVRPSMRGKPKPKRGASQSAKDAYYVTLPSPKQVAAQPFMRPAFYKQGDAIAAVQRKFWEVVNAK